MKAWILEQPASDGQPAELRLGERPDPELGEGELLVAVRASGICRGDVRAIRGERPLPQLPVVLGHQVIGEVLEGGRRFDPGTRVGVGWLWESCGACADCFRGDENLCRRATHTGADVDGGFAERLKVPEGFAYEVPSGLQDVEAASVLCAGVVAYRSLRQGDVEEGESLGLYGFGACARIAMQMAQHMGCHVHVISANEEHRRHATQAGAEWVGAPGEVPPEPLDRAVVFSPRAEFLREALEATRWGGTVASAAGHMGKLPPLDYDQALVGERTLRSVTVGTRQDVEDLLTLASEGGVRGDAETFPFDRLPEAVDRLAEGRVEGGAVLVL